MKEKILLTMLFILACAPAHAMLIPAVDIGMAYNDGTWYNAGSSYISPANKGGFARGFSLGQDYHVSTISGFVTGFSEYNDPPAWASFSLYQGSILSRDGQYHLPGSNLILSSDRFSVPLDGTERAYGVNGDYHLTADDYWLVWTGAKDPAADAPAIMTVGGYNLEGDGVMTAARFSEIHNPEPATLALMGGGLMAMFRRRKAKVA